MDIKDDVTPEIQRIKKELSVLKECKIHVGVQGVPGTNAFEKGVKGSEADLLTIAGVHEYGATIKAVHARNLTIPIHKDSRGKRVRDFPNLFFIKSGETGNVFGVVLKGNRKNKDNVNNLKFLFLLLPSVQIPERSFIRAGYDANVDNLEEAVKRALTGIVHEGWNGRQAADYIGGRAVGFIQEYINEASNFTPKSSITNETNEWSNKPLMETGRLRNAISFSIEGG